MRALHDLPELCFIHQIFPPAIDDPVARMDHEATALA